MFSIARKSDVSQVKNTKLAIFHLGSVRDLVQATPIDQLNELGKFEVTWIVMSGAGFVIKNSIPQRNYVETQSDFSLPHLFALMGWLREQKFGLCLHLLSPAWLKWACLASGIRYRLGALGNPLDSLILNSNCAIPDDTDLHMTDIYHQITAQSFQIIQDDRGMPHLSLQPKDTGIFMQLKVAPQQYYTVHCSATNGLSRWPSQNYLELIKALANDFPVIVTLDAKDIERTKPLEKKLSHLKNVIWMGAKLKPAQHLDVISQARVYIGPDSDATHVAAACGVPVIGIYSNFAEDQPQRWRPRGRLTVTAQPHENFKEKDSIKRLGVRQVLEKTHRFS